MWNCFFSTNTWLESWRTLEFMLEWFSGSQDPRLFIKCQDKAQVPWHKWFSVSFCRKYITRADTWNILFILSIPASHKATRLPSKISKISTTTWEQIRISLFADPFPVDSAHWIATILNRGIPSNDYRTDDTATMIRALKSFKTVLWSYESAAGTIDIGRASDKSVKMLTSG